MSLHPTPEPDPFSKTGVLWLNGLVWNVVVCSYLVGITAEGGPYSGLGALLLCFLLAFLDVVANAGLCLWKLIKGNRYQAGLYFIGLIPLLAVFLVLQSGLSHIGKIGG